MISTTIVLWEVLNVFLQSFEQIGDFIMLSFLHKFHSLSFKYFFQLFSTNLIPQLLPFWSYRDTRRLLIWIPHFNCSNYKNFRPKSFIYIRSISLMKPLFLIATQNLFWLRKIHKVRKIKINKKISFVLTTISITLYIKKLYKT